MHGAQLRQLMDARQAAQDGTARELRLRARVTQTEVADVCDVDPSTVSRWEAGERLPRGRGGRAYARLLAEWSARNGDN